MTTIALNSNVDRTFAKTKKMPVVFIGHGSPMNAIQENNFTKSLNTLGYNIGKPTAILIVSAHWLTNGVTAIQKSLHPELIYDFGGFPQELFNVKYPANGFPELASSISKKLNLLSTEDWGLDHGSWTVLKHIYPKADVPVFQLSIDFSKPPEFHYNLGKELSFLREQGVLIIGSGNIIHNLRTVDWKSKGTEPSEKWAKDLGETVKSAINSNDFKKLIDYKNLPSANIGIANPDHYYPFLYMLGAAQNSSDIKYTYEGFDLGTLDMRCVQWI